MEVQIEEQTKLFIENSTKGVEIRNYKVSKIFDWFKEDFGANTGIINFIQEYLPKHHRIEKIKSYLYYDWGRNSKTQ